MRIVVAAESSDKAKSELQTRIAEHMSESSSFDPKVFREEVLFDGTESVTAQGKTEEDAVQRTRVWTIPQEAKAVDTNTTPPGESRTEIVEAFDEDGARTKLHQKFGWDLLIDSVILQTHGRKGFLGIGKTPSTYEAIVRSPASATVTYRFGRASAFLFSNFMNTCQVCNIKIDARDYRKAMEGSEETYIPRVCDGCGNWVCWWCACHLLSPAYVPTDYPDKIRESLSVRDRVVRHEGCGGTVITFKDLMAAPAPRKTHPVCSSCGKAIAEEERQPDKLGRIHEQLFSDSPMAKFGITIGCAMKCNQCGEWICAKCAETAALQAGAGALKHMNCGGMFETIKA